jgi:hypothetical protein
VLRVAIAERMASVSATLPTWAAPPVMLAPVSATGRAMQIGMTSKDHSIIEMSMTAYWTIRARLLEVPGVANVALWNERLQMMQVQVDPTAMQQRNVSLDQVMQATADAVDSGLLRFSSGSVIGTGGMVETPNQRLSVRNGKGLKDRTVYLAPNVLQTLQAYLTVRGEGSSDHVFLFRNAALSKDFIRSRLKTIGKRVGVKVYPHRLRHTCGRSLGRLVTAS